MTSTTEQILTREDNKELNHEERAAGQLVLSSLPLVAKIELTIRCNLACTMCATHDADRVRQDLDFDTFMALEPLFPYLLSTYLYGIGEPLLHPRVLDMVDVLSRYDVNVGIISNGLLLDAKTADAFVEKNLYKLSLSIDGATAATYEKIRRGGSFNTLMQNIEYLAEVKAARKQERPFLTFNFVSMRDTIGELTDLIKLAKKYGAHEVIVSDLIPFTPQMRPQVLSYDDPLLTDSYQHAQAYAKECGITLVLPHTYSRWLPYN